MKTIYKSDLYLIYKDLTGIYLECIHHNKIFRIEQKGLIFKHYYIITNKDFQTNEGIFNIKLKIQLNDKSITDQLNLISVDTIF